MNRWSFLAILVVVAGSVAAFAIYTFGWREEDNTGSEHQARADADTLAASCDPEACQLKRLVHIDGNDWKVVLRDPSNGQVACALIQTNRFTERAGGTLLELQA